MWDNQVNNALNVTHLMLGAEGLLALQQLGVDPSVALEAINGSSGRSLQTEQRLPQDMERKFLTRRFGYGFKLPLMAKDCRIAAEVLETLPSSQRRAWRILSGPRCPFAHGAKEQLYHPNYFRTLVCRDLQRRRCPRAHLCAFFHRQSDCRKIKHDPVDYSRPLPEKDVPSDWLLHFLNPPKFQEAAQDYGLESFMQSAMAPAMPLHQMPFYPAYCKEDLDSGSVSTAEELHEDAETTSSLAATHVPPSLTLGAEDAWTLLSSGHKGEELYWNEAMPYFNQYSEAFASPFTGSIAAVEGAGGAYAASVQAAHAARQPKAMQGMESFDVAASLLSHLGIGDVASTDLVGRRDI
ncbi:unnamed protein product [Durusdinium trenchii]|uniref:3-hydroxyisobutyrate dehydrogenase-like NAD-binding domain-containing protein n=1 Tax=Durusdinium trenchii TaxID=1381693 RepID=A0ABP0RGY0_9DINO